VHSALLWLRQKFCKLYNCGRKTVSPHNCSKCKFSQKKWNRFTTLWTSNATQAREPRTCTVSVFCNRNVQSGLVRQLRLQSAKQKDVRLQLSTKKLENFIVRYILFNNELSRFQSPVLSYCKMLKISSSVEGISWDFKTW